MGPYWLWDGVGRGGFQTRPYNVHSPARQPHGPPILAPAGPTRHQSLGLAVDLFDRLPLPCYSQAGKRDL